MYVSLQSRLLGVKPTNSCQVLHVTYPTTVRSLFSYRSQISTGTFWVRWPLLCQSSVKVSAAYVTDEKRTASRPNAGEQSIRQGIEDVHPCLCVLSPKEPVTETLPHNGIFGVAFLGSSGSPLTSSATEAS